MKYKLFLDTLRRCDFLESSIYKMSYNPTVKTQINENGEVVYTIVDIADVVAQKLCVNEEEVYTSYSIDLLTNDVRYSDLFYMPAYNRLSFDKQTLIDELIYMTQFMCKDTDAQQNTVECEVLFRNNDNKTHYPYVHGFYSAIYNKTDKTLSIVSKLDFSVDTTFDGNYTYLTLDNDEIHELLPENIRAYLTDDTTILNKRMQTLLISGSAIKEVSQDILQFHQRFLKDDYDRCAERAEIQFFNLSYGIDEWSDSLFEDIAHFYLGDKYDADVEYDDGDFSDSGVYIIEDDLIDDF